MQPITPMLMSVAPPTKNAIGVPTSTVCQNVRIAWAMSAKVPPTRKL